MEESRGSSRAECSASLWLSWNEARLSFGSEDAYAVGSLLGLQKLGSNPLNLIPTGDESSRGQTWPRFFTQHGNYV